MKLSSCGVFSFLLEDMEGKIIDFFCPYYKYLEALIKKSWEWSWEFRMQREIVAATKIIILSLLFQFTIGCFHK